MCKFFGGGFAYPEKGDMQRKTTGQVDNRIQTAANPFENQSF